MGQGFPGTTDCWNHEILTTHSTQGPAVGKHDTCIWTYMNIACRFACRICSWLQDTAGGGQELTISLYKPIIFCRGGTLIFALTAGDRREIHSLFRISRVIWCYMMLCVVQFGLNSQTKIVPVPTRETGVLTLLRPCNSRWNGLQDKDMQRGQGWKVDLGTFKLGLGSLRSLSKALAV